VNIELRDVTVRYGRTTAVDRLSLSLTAGRIYGLLGRNGAGKTSLLSVVAAFRRPSGGRALVDGAEVFENQSVSSRVCFVRDRIDADDTERVDGVLRMAARLRPTWDEAYARRLVDLFDLPLRRKVSALSRGMKSALGITLGLAARAPVTIFDESYLGLDAPSRYAFYDELLADYTDHPRTIIISTHLIEEVARLFEEVVIIDRGKLVLHQAADDLRARGAAATGPAAAVDRFIGELAAGPDEVAVLSERSLGPTKAVTVFGELTPRQRHAAKDADIELGPVGLQDIFVHLTKGDRHG
jgi:ABC-2 type transport system ATP-binding protein